MLEGYVSEKEQLEAIGKWWKEHGKPLLVAVVIGLALGITWRFWHKLGIQRAQNASMLYQQVLQADSQNNFKKAEGGIDLLMQHYSSTPYATTGALLYAKEALLQNQLSVALEKLQWVIDHSALPRFKEMARINAARILLSQGKSADALTQLKTTDDKSFLPLVAWVKGDIFTAQGDTKKAQENYSKAKEGLADFPPAQAMLTQLSAS